MEDMRGKRGSFESKEELLLEANAMVDMVQNEQIEITTNHQWALGMAMQMAFTVAPHLAGRNWLVVHRDSEKKSFITTDAPVLLTTVAPREKSFWGVGFGNTDALIAFPLTESCALVMHGTEGDFSHKIIQESQVRHFNLAMADRCQRFVIGRDADLVRSLAKHRNLSKKRWLPKMQMS
jgi:hypothetical protein